MATTLSTLLTAYHANRSYDLNDSLTEAQTFVTTCRGLLVELASRQEHRGLGEAQSMELDTSLVRDEMRSAQAWIAQKDTSSNPSVVYPDFGNFR